MVYNMTMASVLIKDLPADLHQRLREAAARDHRSMSKEVIALLEMALSTRPSQLPPPSRATFPLTDDWLERAVAEGRK